MMATFPATFPIQYPQVDINPDIMDALLPDLNNSFA